jgi:uncharacterized protein with ParB-like and HNH nuclease domain
MDDSELIEELKTVEETDEAPYVEYDISVSPSDPTLELLVQQIERGDVIIPFYQRRYVWKIEQASRLIESFLMGLPVPQVFLFVNEEDILEIIDGQQRLMSVKYFFEGLFDEEDNKGRRQVFKLKGLSERSEYNDKTFAELPTRDQRKLKNSTLRAINIKQITPDSESDSVFHIFERLNTGGTRLKAQEIRNAVYRGAIVEELKKLNDDSNWQNILGLKKPDGGQKDVELVLRLFSLFEVWNRYEKPMLRYLNFKMNENRDFDSDRAIRFSKEFLRAVRLVNDNLDRPFRPRGVINSAVLEAVMVCILENDKITGQELAERYTKLVETPEFMKTVTGGTTDTLQLTTRISTAKGILENAEG